MKKLFAVLALLAFTSPVFAADNKITTGVEHTEYSEVFGERTVASVEYAHKDGQATWVFNGGWGHRETEDGSSFTGERLSGQLYYNWTDSVYTRTYVAASTDDPVFAQRDFAQDVNVKLGANTWLLIGGRYAEYFDDVTVRSYSAGITQKLGKRLSGSYRITHYDSSTTGVNYGHLASLKWYDQSGPGSTQLWLGYADTLHVYDWLEGVGEGTTKSIVVRRVQPITSSLAINLMFGKSWYETPVANYDGLQGGISLTYGW